MNDEYDIVVIGAGFAGLSAAISASRSGAKTLMVAPVLAKTIPAGAVGLDLLGIGPKTAAAFKEVGGHFPPFYIETYGFKYISPEGKTFTDRSEEVRGWTLMTTEATEILFKKAIVEGTEYIKALVIDFIINNGSVDGVILDDGRTIRSKMVICACGYNPGLIRKLGVAPPKDSVFALQTILDMKQEGDEHLLFTFFCGNQWSDSLGGYLMPVSKKRAVLALGAKSRATAHSQLLSVIKEHPVISRQVEWNPGMMHGGMISLGIVERSYGNGFILVGDAAGHFRPIGGVGSGNALIFGRMAGTIGAEAVDEGDTSSDRLKAYETVWQATPEGQSLKQLFPYSEIMRNADDGVLENAFSGFEGKKITKTFYLELIERVSSASR